MSSILLPYVLTSSGNGTVTGVSLALPDDLFTISGSPVTTSGTLTGSLKTQVANLIFAGPGSGADAAPTFRALVDADIPDTITLSNLTQVTTRLHSSLQSIGANDHHNQSHDNTDHSIATPAIILGTAAATGVAASLIRSDATIAAFDATVPGTIAEGATAATGSVAFAARRDHTHGAPATWAATAHNVLSATHGDSTAGTVVRGDLITGQGATPKWTRLAKGTANQVLSMDGSATDIVWATAATGITVGTTVITSGTTTRLFYDAAGVVGEITGVTSDGTNLSLSGKLTSTVTGPVLSNTNADSQILLGTATDPGWTTPALHLRDTSGDATIFSWAGGNLGLASNVYFDGQRKFINSAAAAMAVYGPASLDFLFSAAGTAGNVVSWTTSFSASDSGFQIGSPTGGGKGTGTINAASTYYANGTAGVASFGPAGVTSITIKNGLVTAIS